VLKHVVGGGEGESLKMRPLFSSLRKYFTCSALVCVLFVLVFLWIRIVNRGEGTNGGITLGNSARMRPLYSLYTSDYGSAFTISNPFCRFLSHCLHNRTICVQEFDQLFVYENRTNCVKESFPPVSVILCFGPVSSTATVGFVLGMEFGPTELQMIESVSC